MVISYYFILKVNKFMCYKNPLKRAFDKKINYSYTIQKLHNI